MSSTEDTNGEDLSSHAELVFIYEAIEQAAAAVRARRRMERELLHGTTDEFWDAVEQLLNAAVRVANVFWTSSTNSKVKRRSRTLRARLDLESVSAFSDLREVRNSFEHIDERIDAWAERSGEFFLDRTILGSRGSTYVGDDAEMVDRNTARSYHSDTNEIRVFGKSVSADALVNEVIVLRQHLKDKTGR
ncbi:hypothetical protein EDF42_2179 [Curtobacterium sp. PhB172]|uniref:hypothetical protein n=1 Tax=Curtobacterium sp. PhB172 TaxID=2485196 RepID=UPI000F4B41A5|nr:hypothetical protein [Curtobacterium sp. PhB172]ROS63925.1 hypothetical protein EDF42_2179 [Curtobacterium sp. PhB172]